MKNSALIYFFMIAFSLMFHADSASAQDTQPAYVAAYYFHGDVRCPTCKKLEQYSKEAVEGNFKDEIGSGRLVFKEINVESKGNEHFVDDYKLYTKTLVLSLVKDGKQAKWTNLDKIWEYAGNKQKFIDYVKAGVADLLKEAQ